MTFLSPYPILSSHANTELLSFGYPVIVFTIFRHQFNIN